MEVIGDATANTEEIDAPTFESEGTDEVGDDGYRDENEGSAGEFCDCDGTGD